MISRAEFLFLLVGACASVCACANDGPGYDTISIVAPKQDATVYDNQGTVDVSVEASPALRSDRGDHIALLLDGKVVASGADARHRLTDVDRGTHTLQAQVIAADGTLLLVSSETRFHMWRASRLSPARKN